MEYIANGSLADLIKKVGPLTMELSKFYAA